MSGATWTFITPFADQTKPIYLEIDLLYWAKHLINSPLKHCIGQLLLVGREMLDEIDHVDTLCPCQYFSKVVCGIMVRALAPLPLGSENVSNKYDFSVLLYFFINYLK